MVLWIITVADAYEAMTATSKYKRVFSNEKVLVELNDVQEHSLNQKIWEYLKGTVGG